MKQIRLNKIELTQGEVETLILAYLTSQAIRLVNPTVKYFWQKQGTPEAIIVAVYSELPD